MTNVYDQWLSTLTENQFRDHIAGRLECPHVMGGVNAPSIDGRTAFVCAAFVAVLYAVLYFF